MPVIGVDINPVILSELTGPTLVLGDLTFTNIKTGDLESHEIQHDNQPNVILIGQIGDFVVREYTLDCVCDTTPFRDFVNNNRGKPTSLSLEGKTYWGYVTDYSIDDERINFTFESVA